VLSRVQAVDKGFLPRIHGVTLCDKTRRCEICKALNVETLLRIKSSPLQWSFTWSECPRKEW